MLNQAPNYKKYESENNNIIPYHGGRVLFAV